jgi:hypothetical protein
MELDAIIVDDVTDIFAHNHHFTALADFTEKRSHQMASGFMAWSGALDLKYLDEQFTAAHEREYSQSYDRWGDQGYVAEHLREPIDLTSDLFPGRIVSYKWHVRRQGFVPKGASVVMFHGKPRPAEIGWKLP